MDQQVSHYILEVLVYVLNWLRKTASIIYKTEQKSENYQSYLHLVVIASILT